MLYTIGEMAKKLHVPASTLRYYDKEGLLPFVERSGGGMRVFKDADFEWLQIIGCLKKSGMSLFDIKHFIELAIEGDGTISERLELIIAQKKKVEQQIEGLNRTLAMLEFKEWYYTTAKQEGTTDKVRNLKPGELPQKYRSICQELKGE